MIRRHATKAGLLLLLAAAAAPQAACGKVGELEQPGPMFGDRAKADYQAQKAAQAAAAQRRSQQQNSNAAADQPDPTDNAPVTKRDLQAPEQRLTPLSQDPLPGTVSDPRGAPPSLTPPN